MSKPSRALSQIKAALKPMRDAIAARQLAALRQMVDRHDQVLREVDAEIRTAVSSTPGDQSVGARRWNTPRWFGPGWLAGTTVEEACEECRRFVSPYTLATRDCKGDTSSREHTWRRRWWIECFGYAARRKDLSSVAVKMADRHISAMVDKLTKKLSPRGSIAAHTCSGATLDDFVVDVTFEDGGRVRVYTNLIHNQRQGRPYVQWPSRIYSVNADGSTGELIPEASLRRVPTGGGA